MGLAYGNEVQDFILDHSPCGEARAWLRAGEFQTLAEAWDACPRGDWMMWALRKTGKVDHKTLILLACDFADHVLSFYENKFVGDLRPRTAIEAVRKYTSGDITLTELRKAKNGAYAAADAAYAAAAAAAYAAADAAYAAAADAAYAAAYAAAGAAAGAAGAAGAAAYAAAGAAYAAAGAAGAARVAERKWQAGRIRELVGNPY